MKNEYIKPNLKMLILSQEQLMAIISGTEVSDDDFEEGAKEFTTDNGVWTEGHSVWED
jgi:hypothetical protein